MARKPRDHAAEYARRVDPKRLAKLGITKAQARGHARPAKGERPVSEITGTPLRGAAKRGHKAKQRLVERGVDAIQRATQRALEIVTLPPVPWSGSTERGTRDFRTGDRELVRRALREARSRSHDVLVGVRSEGVQLGRYRRQKRKRRDEDWVYTGRTWPGYILQSIEGQGGDVDRGIKRYMVQEEGTVIGEIVEYLVKEFGDTDRR